MRLIDADALKELLAEEKFDKEAISIWIGYERDLARGRNSGIITAIRFVDRAPTIDPVKHGHWVVSEGGYKYRCSECGEISLSNYVCEPEPSKYCPDCGAKMDEEVEVSDGKAD